MSCLCCCTRTGHQPKRASEYPEALKPIVVAINTRGSDGVQEQGTGILISDYLVLTSHMGLPSRESAFQGQIALRNVGPSNSLPSTWPSSSTILTRKLLPQSLFVTNPGLGLTIVACEPVNFNLSPRKYEVPQASEDGLRLGCSVYVLGQVQHDGREGLLMFGEGLVSREDEQLIEFYSLDGYVWAPGSAGFDAKGTFAFVVGDRRQPPKVSCPLRKRWSYALSKGPSSTQPGILIHAVRDWTQDTWRGDFSTLLQLCSSGPTALDATSAVFNQKAEKAKDVEPQSPMSNRVDEIQSTVRDNTETRIPRIRATRSSFETCGKSSYRATDSNSTITSPNIKDIPVQPSFPPLHVLVSRSNVETRHVLVSCSNVEAKDQTLTPKPQSPPNLRGGIAALAAEELEKYDEKCERFAQRDAGGNQTADSPCRDCVDGLIDVDFHQGREAIYDGRPTCGSPENEFKSPRSCWFSSWWSNCRPKSPQQQRRKSVQAAANSAVAVAAEFSNVDSGKTEEVIADSLEPNSPPRRFLVRGSYTANPRREFSSWESSSHTPNSGATKPTSTENSYSPLENSMINPPSPTRTVRPCESTLPQAPSRPLSPEIPYLQIHRSLTSGCPRQSDIPWKPPGELDSRRMLPPPDPPPRPLTGVARTRTYPRDYCPPRSEGDEQKELDEETGRKGSAGTDICMKVVELSTQVSDATASQDRIVTQSPIAVQTTSPREEVCGENGTLESGSSDSCPHDSSSASQSTRDHEVYEVNCVTLPESTCRLTSRKSRRQVIECTFFQRWQKFVTRKKNVAFETMKSLCSPRTISVSTASSRSISQSPDLLGSPPQTARTSCNLASSEPLSDDGTIAADAAPWFQGLPLPILNCSRCSEAQATAQLPSKEQSPNTPYDDLSHAQMPSWAMKEEEKIQDESLDLQRKRDLFIAYGGRERKTMVEAAAQVKLGNDSCIANLSPVEDETGAAEDRSPSTTASRSEVASRSSPRVHESYMMTGLKKERTDQRKEIRNQRPRWSIARIDKRPFNIGSVSDPLDDLTKSKLKMKKQQQVNINSGPIRAMVSPLEEATVIKRNSGVRALANQDELSTARNPKSEHEGQTTRPSSPSRKPPLNSNCKGKITSKDSVTERSMSPSRPVKSSSKKLLETPTGRKGSSVSSSSSDREGRPRWRCL